MPKTEYQGFKNYPTWAVRLWLLNEPGLYNELSDWIEQSNDSDDLAILIREWWYDYVDSLVEKSGPLRDISLYTSREEIDFNQIADSLY